MERTCARAVELGLPSLTFTEHADLTPWQRGEDGVFRAPELDVAGYAECVRICRERFPQLRIGFGVELSEPHWHGDAIAQLLRTAGFERVLGSVHSFNTRDGYLFIDDLFKTLPAHDVVREYLAEVLRMIDGDTSFQVLAHIDYPVRYWPAGAAPFDPTRLSEEFRTVLRALSDSGRVLEINSRIPLHPQVVRWWYEVGGAAVSFGSDAHEPDLLAHRFAQTAALAEAAGFRPAADPHAFWIR
jgi:histidinol-phosphatase (PHP family)